MSGHLACDIERAEKNLLLQEYVALLDKARVITGWGLLLKCQEQSERTLLAGGPSQRPFKARGERSSLLGEKMSQVIGLQQQTKLARP